MIIKVNIKEFLWSHPNIFYEDIARFAGYSPDDVITVTYVFPGKNNVGGSLIKGEGIGAIDGLRITATITNNA